MADWGIKVSRDGEDVKTAGLDDMVLHSQYYTFKTKERLTTTLTLTAGSTTATKNVAHGLGYSPVVFASMELNTNKWYNINSIQNVKIDSAPSFAYNAWVSSDATNIIFNLVSGTTFGSDQTYDITYYTVIDEV